MLKAVTIEIARLIGIVLIVFFLLSDRVWADPAVSDPAWVEDSVTRENILHYLGNGWEVFKEEGADAWTLIEESSGHVWEFTVETWEVIPKPKDGYWENLWSAVKGE